MIKKREKWIALLVIFSFLWLLQVSVTPLGAAEANTQEQIGSADAEQAPYFVEKAGSAAAYGKKSPLLPIMIGVVGAAVVAAVLIFVVFKTNYDITGKWTLNYTMPGWPLSTYPLTCTGDKKSGTAATNLVSGNYAVDVKKVTINLIQRESRWEFIGEFKSKVRIEGDFKYYINDVLQPQYSGIFYMDKNQ